MTSYQDQPLSRRAIREREAAASAQGPADGVPDDAPAGEDPSTAPPAPTTHQPVWSPYGAPVASTPPVAQPPADDASDASGDSAAQPADAWSPIAAPVTEGITMTRRQLRALREAQERAVGSGTTAHDSTAPVTAPGDASAAPAWAPPAASVPPLPSADPVAEPANPADAPADAVPAAPVAWEPAAWEPAMPDPATWGPARSEPLAEPVDAVPTTDEQSADEAVADDAVADGSEAPADEVPSTPAWLQAFTTPAAEQPATAPETPQDAPEDSAPESATAETPTGTAAAFEALLAGDPAGADAWTLPSSVPPLHGAPAAPPAAEAFPWQPPTGLVFIPPQPADSADAEETSGEETPLVDAPASDEAPVAEIVDEDAVDAPAELAEDALAEAVPAEIPEVDAQEAVPAADPAEVVAEVVEQTDPEVAERPRNHWSRQAELDDEVQPATESLIREVGVSSATANALVLPEVPNPDMLVSSFQPSGDGYMTGSIVLPQSLSATGALPAQLDESELDHMLDPGDQQVASTDSQPVRAIRAVSTHTSSREIIGTVKPKRGNRALTALIIAAAGMAVVVVTLLVVALASGVLG